MSEGDADFMEGPDNIVGTVTQHFMSNGLLQTYTTLKSMEGRDYMEVRPADLTSGFVLYTVS